MSHIIGYARVSTTDQDTAIQRDKLKAAGCDLVLVEKMSGKSRDGREELDKAMSLMTPGAVLMVTKLDRLGRSTRDVLNIVHEIDQRGGALRVLEPAIDTGDKTGVGKMVLTVLGMVAEMELGFIRARQREGIDKAKAAGIYKGRPVTLDHTKVLTMLDQGAGPTTIMKELGCSRAAIYKIKRLHSKAAPKPPN